jgi:hypothetical protein
MSLKSNVKQKIGALIEKLRSKAFLSSSRAYPITELFGWWTPVCNRGVLFYGQVIFVRTRTDKLKIHGDFSGQRV